MSDGSIRPGVDSATQEPIDLITAYQLAGSDDEVLKKRIACEACPGHVVVEVFSHTILCKLLLVLLECNHLKWCLLHLKTKED